MKTTEATKKISSVYCALVNGCVALWLLTACPDFDVTIWPYDGFSQHALSPVSLCAIVRPCVSFFFGRGWLTVHSMAMLCRASSFVLHNNWIVWARHTTIHSWAPTHAHRVHFARTPPRRRGRRGSRITLVPCKDSDEQHGRQCFGKQGLWALFLSVLSVTISMC